MERTLDTITEAIRHRVAVKRSVQAAFKAEGNTELTTQYAGELQALDELLLALSSEEDFTRYAKG